MTDALTDDEKNARQVARLAEREQRTLEALPDWQRHLAENAAFKHYTEDQTPPLKVVFHDTRLEVPDASPVQARHITSVVGAVLPAHGIPVLTQSSQRGNGLTIHLDV